MKNKKITRIIILLYIVLLFAYPYILGRNVSDINGSLPFFDKIVQNTNLIPFNFNYDINLDIIVKNIALKLLLFVPFNLKLPDFNEYLILNENDLAVDLALELSQ